MLKQRYIIILFRRFNEILYSFLNFILRICKIKVERKKDPFTQNKKELYTMKNEVGNVQQDFAQILAIRYAQSPDGQ